MAAPGYEPIRVRVAAVLVIDGGIVLVRHRKHGRSYHLLPGGGVEAGETLQDALVREVAEETGLSIEVSRLLFINDSIDPRGGRDLLNVTFLATITGGAIAVLPLDPRVEGVDVVMVGDLTGLDLRPPIGAALVEAHADDFARGARYLGSLWTDEPPAPAGTDGGEDA